MPLEQGERRPGIPLVEVFVRLEVGVQDEEELIGGRVEQVLVGVLVGERVADDAERPEQFGVVLVDHTTKLASPSPANGRAPAPARTFGTFWRSRNAQDGTDGAEPSGQL